MIHIIRTITTSSRFICQRKQIKSFSSTITAIDRLLRIKPAITKIDESKEIDNDIDDGKPSPDDADIVTDNPPIKLGKKILKLGKIYYKHIEYLPDWVQQRKNEICSHRTPAQIRRCLKSWMISYDRDDQALYRDRNLGWSNRLPKKLPPVISYGPEETVAYGHYFFPSRFSIMKRVLGEVKTILPTYQPLRVLDFGCGPATGFAATRSVWDSRQDFHKYVGIDISQSMLDAAKIMTENKGVDCVFWDKIGEVVKLAHTRNERFDLIICSYTLNELSTDTSRKAAVQLLFELLDEGGIMLIVEGGNPVGSHTVRTARQFALNFFNEGRDFQVESSDVSPVNDDNDSHNMKKKSTDINDNDKDDSLDDANNDTNNIMNGFKDPLQLLKKDSRKKKTPSSSSATKNVKHVLPPPKPYKSNDELRATVISPCVHDKPCPLGPGVWCSFAQKVHSGMIRKESLEKFSYVVLGKVSRAATNQKSDMKSSSSFPLVRKLSPVMDPFAKKTIQKDPNSTVVDSSVTKTKGRDPWYINSLQNSINDENPTPLVVLKEFISIHNKHTNITSVLQNTNSSSSISTSHIDSTTKIKVKKISDDFDNEEKEELMKFLSRDESTMIQQQSQDTLIDIPNTNTNTTSTTKDNNTHIIKNHVNGSDYDSEYISPTSVYHNETLTTTSHTIDTETTTETEEHIISDTIDIAELGSRKDDDAKLKNNVYNINNINVDEEEEDDDDDDDDDMSMDDDKEEEEDDDDKDDEEEDEVGNIEGFEEYTDKFGNEYLRPIRRVDPKVKNFINNLLDKTDWHEYNPALYQKEWTRVIRTPLKKKGHIMLDLCHPSGTISRYTVSKKQTRDVPYLYSAIRKTTWGGLFPALGRPGETSDSTFSTSSTENTLSTSKNPSQTSSTSIKSWTSSKSKSIDSSSRLVEENNNDDIKFKLGNAVKSGFNNIDKRTGKKKLQEKQKQLKYNSNNNDKDNISKSSKKQIDSLYGDKDSNLSEMDSYSFSRKKRTVNDQKDAMDHDSTEDSSSGWTQRSGRKKFNSALSRLTKKRNNTE